MMSFVAKLFTLANAPYTVALLVVAFYVTLQVIGLLPWGEHGAHADADGAGEGGGHADGHADVDADLDADADADVHGEVDGHGDHDVDHGHDADHEAGHDGAHAGVIGSLLSVLGVGKVPVAVIWQTLFTMFGLVGIAATTILAGVTGHYRGAYLAGTLPLAVVVGTLLSGLVVRGVARLIPSSSGDASRRRDLVGCLGVVISSKCTDDFGEVRLKDPQGRTLRLICRAAKGEPPIPEGTEVVVVEYDRVHDHLHVAAQTKYLEGRQ